MRIGRAVIGAVIGILYAAAGLALDLVLWIHTYAMTEAELFFVIEGTLYGFLAVGIAVWGILVGIELNHRQSQSGPKYPLYAVMLGLRPTNENTSANAIPKGN